MKKIIWILSLIMMSTVILSGCGEEKSSGDGGEKEKLVVALPSKMFLNLPEYLAKEKGYFEEQNLEVEFLNIADSSVPVKNLIANKVDLVYTGTSETLAAASKGANVKVLGGVNLGLHYGFYVGADSGIERIEDIVGKNVAVSSPGSLPHVAFLGLLNKAGVSQEDIDKINWVPISGSSARIQGVIAGKVDATLASYKPETLEDPSVEMLYVVPEKLPEFVMTSLDTSDKVLEEKRDAIKRFIKADLKALRYILDNKEEALEFAGEVIESDPRSLEKYYEFYTKNNIWRVNGELQSEDVQYMQQLNKDNGIQEKIVPSEEVFDGSLVDEVLEDIGKR